jgi:hypothetical protein
VSGVRPAEESGGQTPWVAYCRREWGAARSSGGFSSICVCVCVWGCMCGLVTEANCCPATCHTPHRKTGYTHQHLTTKDSQREETRGSKRTTLSHIHTNTHTHTHTHTEVHIHVHTRTTHSQIPSHTHPFSGSLFLCEWAHWHDMMATLFSYIKEEQRRKSEKSERARKNNGVRARALHERVLSLEERSRRRVHTQRRAYFSSSGVR